MNKMMTKQEAFDKVYKHFVINGNPTSVVRKKRRNGGFVSVCMYRSPSGAKCSAGLFLHGYEYKPSYEGQPFFRVCPKRLKHLVYFIVELQYVHDAVAMFSDEHITSSFRKKLIDVADRHNLTIPR